MACQQDDIVQRNILGTMKISISFGNDSWWQYVGLEEDILQTAWVLLPVYICLVDPNSPMNKYHAGIWDECSSFNL